MRRSSAETKAVILAANTYQRLMPMMMTAAGTIKAARVVVLGAGVAGLQAIATAKRLGAVIEASDVRPAVKEQIESLGAKFVELPIQAPDAQTAGGYAKAQSDEFYRKQTELLAQRIALVDGVISTREPNGANWLAITTKKSPVGEWTLTLPNADAVKSLFRSGEIEDILFVITYSGRTPAWPT